MLNRKPYPGDVSAIDESVKLAYVDQGYTEELPATEAEAHGMRLEMDKHPEAKRDFVYCHADG